MYSTKIAIILLLAATAIGGIAGLLIGYFLRKLIARGQVGSSEIKAEKVITEAKNKGQEYLVKIKEKALKIIDDAKKEEGSRRREIQNIKKD